jgi:hypothetical protein
MIGNFSAKAHGMALLAITTPLVGLRLDDIKWAVSIVASIFGTLAALYIARANRRCGVCEARDEAARIVRENRYAPPRCEELPPKN